LANLASPKQEWDTFPPSDAPTSLFNSAFNQSPTKVEVVNKGIIRVGKGR